MSELTIEEKYKRVSTVLKEAIDSGVLRGYNLNCCGKGELRQSGFDEPPEMECCGQPTDLDERACEALEYTPEPFAEGYKTVLQMYQELQPLVKVLADIPIEEFNQIKVEDLQQPLMAWNGHAIRVGHVVKARKTIQPWRAVNRRPDDVELPF
jgi:hypothetical protein